MHIASILTEFFLMSCIKRFICVIFLILSEDGGSPLVTSPISFSEEDGIDLFFCEIGSHHFYFYRRFQVKIHMTLDFPVCLLVICLSVI